MSGFLGLMCALVARGTVVAGFRVESLIGEGAMGSVYLAERIDGGEHIALKLLLPELARDERFRQRFLRESQVATSLDHPHIVPTLTSGEHGGRLYLVMTYIDGADLRHLLRREGRLEPHRALDLIDQVARALDVAHAAGLVHRDVKPGNILVASTDEREHAYVCDFGLARHVSSVSSLTSERGFVGTIDYVSPEQIEGTPIDGRADVYSLGCVLYECLAGERPFDRETELSVLFAHLNEPPAPLSDFRPELPGTLDSVFDKALAKAPKDRYSTCTDLADAARAALEGKTVTGRRRSRPILAAAAVALIAVAAAAGALLETRGPSTRAHSAASMDSVRLRPHGLSLINVRTRQVVARFGLGKQGRFGTTPWDVAFYRGSAWVLVGGVQQLDRINVATRTVTRVLALPWAPGSRIAVGGGSIWLTQDGGSEVMRVDAQNGNVTGRFTVAGQGPGIAYGAGSLWLARGQSVARVDPKSGRVLRRITLADAVNWLAYADGAVWAASGGSGVVVRIDPVENRITATQRLRGWLSDLTVGGGFVWASIVPDGTIFELSEQDLSVQKTTVSGPDPERIYFGGGRLWITNSEAHTVSALDPDTGGRSELATVSAPSVVRYSGGLLWTGSAPTPLPLPPIAGQELRISTPQIFTDADPSTGRPTRQNVQLFYATCANLLDYPDSIGAEGARLRPELATAMPKLSPDGRTYTFRVRQGVRFSPPSNELVTPTTFRHTIERALSPRLQAPWGLPFASDIVGVPAYRAGKAAHISGISVRGNSLSITLQRPSGDFLNGISMFFFCPVPLSEPVVPGGLTGAIPSLGPYYVKSMTDSRTVLLRNPNYAGTRPRRSARIVYTFGTPTSRAVALTDAGQIDLLPYDFDIYSPLAPGGVLDRRYGPGSPAANRGAQRYFLEPMPVVDAVVFNANRPLFRNVRLRRAVSYALDRPALAAVVRHVPDDQLIPPAVRGFPAGRIFPLNRPNLRTARRLAGHGNRHAVLFAATCSTGTSDIGDVLRSDLAKIDIKVAIVLSDACPGRYDRTTERADLLLFAYGGNTLELDPEPFLHQVLASGVYGAALGPGLWSSPSFRKRVDRAGTLKGLPRIEAFRVLDDELMRAAPIAVFASRVYGEYVSPRVGCEVLQGRYGLLDLGALCVHKH